MSHNQHNTGSGLDTDRRSFLQTGAMASAAIALGGLTVGCVSAQDNDTEDDTANGDYVLMLYPDAVEQASATVVSDEVDWNPWDDENEEENEGYRTHLVEFEFSASHVAPVFVPEDVDIDVDAEVDFGEVQEFLHAPDEPIDDPADDTDNDVDTDDENGLDNGDQTAEHGDAILVEIALADDPEDDPDDSEPDDDPMDDENGPDDDDADDPLDDDNGPDDGNDTDDADDGLLSG